MLIRMIGERKNRRLRAPLHSGLHRSKISEMKLWKKSNMLHGTHHGEKHECITCFMTAKIGVFLVNELGVFQFQFSMVRMVHRLLLMKQLNMSHNSLVNTVQTYSLTEMQRIYYQMVFNIQAVQMVS